MKRLPVRLVASLALGVAFQTAGVVRVPLWKDGVELKPPKSYEMGTRTDRLTGRQVEYDPKLDIVLVNPTLGLYEFRWIGDDGKPKTIVYQSPDRIDVIVSATARQLPNGNYQYVYAVSNLATSAEDLAGFAVQALAAEPAASAGPGVHIGRMGTFGPFTVGAWTRFAPLDAASRVAPGQKAEYRITSGAPPGLVECRVHGGRSGIDGIGEELPMELANALPHYEPWPHGYTLGPVEALARLSTSEKATQLASWLPLFEKSGWMSAETTKRYLASLGGGGLATLQAMAQIDLAAGRIAEEVASVIAGMGR